jgi:pimeloyl-ACP methyl ester carboxylesterase
MRKRLRLLSLILVGLFALAAGVLWFFRDEFIYHRKSYRAEILGHVVQQGGRRIEVMTSQGRQVAFYRPPRIHGSGTPEFLWFVFAGRASLALDYWGQTGHWDGRFAYVFVDYPGYGCCEGHPNSEHITESIVAIGAQVRKDLHWSEDDLRGHAGVLGHSLGCGAGLIAADQLGIKRVILCAPFTSLTDMARGTVGWPLCCLNRNHFDNTSRLTALTKAGARVSIFHGTADHTIPCQMSQTLAAQFPTAIQFTRIPNCGHGGLISEAAPQIGRTMLALCGPSQSTVATP